MVIRMRTLIYARYSSQLQNSRSIEDQIRVCMERAEQEGWTVIDGSAMRPLAALLAPRNGNAQA